MHRAPALLLVALVAAAPLAPALAVGCMETLGCPVTLEGRVVDELGEPARVCVIAAPTDARGSAYFFLDDVSPLHAITDADGRYRIDVTPGEWRLETADVFEADHCGTRTSHAEFVHQSRIVAPLAPRQDFVLEYNVMLTGVLGAQPGEAYRPGVVVGRGAAEGGSVTWTDETSGETIALAPTGSSSSAHMVTFQGVWTIPADRAEGSYPARFVVRDAEDRLVEARDTVVLADLTPPRVVSVTPGDGAVVQGMLRLVVVAEDNLALGYGQVRFVPIVDGERTSSGPYWYMPYRGGTGWANRTLAPGLYDIDIRSYDRAGNADVHTVRVRVE